MERQVIEDNLEAPQGVALPGHVSAGPLWGRTTTFTPARLDLLPAVVTAPLGPCMNTERAEVI